VSTSRFISIFCQPAGQTTEWRGWVWGDFQEVQQQMLTRYLSIVLYNTDFSCTEVQYCTNHSGEYSVHRDRDTGGDPRDYNRCYGQQWVLVTLLREPCTSMRAPGLALGLVAMFWPCFCVP